MDEEALVEAVRGFSCLWQTSCKKYKDLRAKENVWKEVSGQVHFQSSTMHIFLCLGIAGELYCGRMYEALEDNQR